MQVMREEDGSVLRSAAKAPRECTDREIAEFEKLVLDGGEVEPQNLRARVKRAETLAFVYSSSEPAGVGALKRPNANYRKSVFERSHVDHSPTGFPLELGWVYVTPAHRRKGISAMLVQLLLGAVGNRNVFATSRTTNSSMQSTLERFGFVCSGHPYASGMGGHMLQLFIRVAVQPVARGNAPEAARPSA